MSESDAIVTVDTDTGPDRTRVVFDGAEQEPDEREHWWPVTVSDDGDGNRWESFV